MSILPHGTTSETAELASGVRIVDTSDEVLDLPTPWAPVKVPGADIEAAIKRLAEMPAPVGGRRSALLVHPESAGRGMSPGIEVSIEVLLPGERTAPLRRNSSLVQISIEGSGTVEVGDTVIELAQYDVCSVPSMKPHLYANNGTAVWARLSYSNAPLLALLGTHYYEDVKPDWKPAPSVDGPVDMGEPGEYHRGTAPDYEVSSTGARLRGYEFLVDIEPVLNRPLHWPYRQMSGLMSHEPADKKRTIMALYNPATERKQGATNSFFVTLSQIPPGHKRPREGRGHRHNSVAINYHFAGTGYSIVDGQRIDWAPGDLLLSAPSWREHAHYFSETGMSVYTVQDHPLHIGMESLIWQEDMENDQVHALGSEAGVTGYVGPREMGG
jgi:gentisate 1,2-dioxygenase